MFSHLEPLIPKEPFCQLALLGLIAAAFVSARYRQRRWGFTLWFIVIATSAVRLFVAIVMIATAASGHLGRKASPTEFRLDEAMAALPYLLLLAYCAWRHPQPMWQPSRAWGYGVAALVAYYGIILTSPLIFSTGIEFRIQEPDGRPIPDAYVHYHSQYIGPDFLEADAAGIKRARLLWGDTVRLGITHQNHEPATIQLKPRLLGLGFNMEQEGPGYYVGLSTNLNCKDTVFHLNPTIRVVLPPRVKRR